MESLYELISPDNSRPVLVAPLGEYFHSRWVRAKEHHAPSVMGTLAKDAASMMHSKAFGHSAPQHTGFAFDTFRHYGMNPVELPDFVPGIHIALDKEAGRVRIFDPLEHLPNRKAIEAAFVAVYHKYRVPLSERVFDGLSASDLHVWQAWLDKAVADGVACQVSGQENSAPEPTVETVVEPTVEPQEQTTEEPAVQDAPVQEQVAKEPPTQEQAVEQPAPVAAPQPVKPVRAARRR